MPKLWNETIDAHRQTVTDTILEKTWSLAQERGVSGVTMSEIAEASGIGRATLYKYFPDVETILVAWHERQIGEHLQELVKVRDAAAPAERLRAVLTAYASLQRGHHDNQLAATLHRGDHVHDARHELLHFIRDLVVEAVESGAIRNDVEPAELAAYCIHAVSAAEAMHSKAAVQRLVNVTLDGLRPPVTTD